jgi:SAM-dependent methyltransferase
MTAIEQLVAHVGHRVHLCRAREVGLLLRWAGDLEGQVVLDVAGGDGYWAGVARGRGARPVALDLDLAKLRRGAGLEPAVGLVAGDALALPVRSAVVDVVLSVCALEHFDDGSAALAEMARVLKPGGRLLLSADVLSESHDQPRERARHVERYHVQDTYDHERLARLLRGCGMDLVRYAYQFRSSWAQRLYLGVSAYGGRAGWNASAPLAPLVAWSDRRTPNSGGSIVVIEARRRAGALP